MPENYISKDVFDLINVYILPKRELERTVLTVNTLGIKIVGYPVKLVIRYISMCDDLTLIIILPL